MSTIGELITEWRAARDEYRAAERKKKELAKEMQRKASKVREALVENGLTNTKCRDGATVYLHKMFSVSVTADNSHEVRSWLIDEFGDDQPFIEQKLNKKSVADRIQDALDNDEIGEFDVPESMKLNRFDDVRIRGAK